MTILFLHGWQSTPGGIKPTYLKDHGHTVLNPALPDEDFDEAVRIAQAEFDRHRPDVVVGSSRGGAVAMNINSGSTPLVLLCPAWKRWGSATTVKPGTVILHSKADDVVPFSDSVELVRNSGLPSESLIAVGTEHRLADSESLGKMVEAVESVSKPKNPATADETRVPRRFGLGRLLAITITYALMLGVVFLALGTPPVVCAVIAALSMAVGLGQKLLRKGKPPMETSAIVGGCFAASLSILCWLANLVFFGGRLVGINDPVEALVFGAVLGYVFGWPIRGIFWVLGE